MNQPVLAGCLVGLLACVPAPGEHRVAAAWGNDLATGPHAVGFRTDVLERSDGDGSVRTMTLAVWYPAQHVDAAVPVTVGDLFDVVLAEGQLGETAGLAPGPALVAAMTGDAGALSTDAADRALALASMATRDPSPAPGRFPLVLWGVRHATVLAQAPLSVLLASHGFVVATVWSSDPPLAFVWEDHPPDAKIAMIDAHADDLRHALAMLRADTTVDPDRVLALAWSYGGQTVSHLQENEGAVRVVISLDANVLPARSEERLLARAPLIALVGRDTVGRGVANLDSLTVPWMRVRLPDLRHGHFNALEGFLPARLGATSFFPWSVGGAPAIDGYRRLAAIVGTLARGFAADPTPDLAALADSIRATAADAEIRVPSGTRRTAAMPTGVNSP